MKQIAFVDAGIADYQTLQGSLPGEIEVFILDPATDGVLQMAGILATHHDLSAVHIFSHGASGALQLGNANNGINPNLGTMNRNTVSYKDDLNLAAITRPTSASFTGILVGDVNNSWVIPA